jgi:hypothetical protein
MPEHVIDSIVQPTRLASTTDSSTESVARIGLSTTSEYRPSLAKVMHPERLNLPKRISIRSPGFRSSCDTNTNCLPLLFSSVITKEPEAVGLLNLFNSSIIARTITQHYSAQMIAIAQTISLEIFGLPNVLGPRNGHEGQMVYLPHTHQGQRAV